MPGSKRVHLGNSPALLALVEPKFLTQAFDELINGKREIYFGTDAQIGQAAGLPIRKVYFKPTGQNQVVAVADFIEGTTKTPLKKRLTGHPDYEWKFYYGFRGIASLLPIPLSSLRFFNTRTPVPDQQPGACIIEEIG
jgi:hypothetical protein